VQLRLGVVEGHVVFSFQDLFESGHHLLLALGDKIKFYVLYVLLFKKDSSLESFNFLHQGPMFSFAILKVFNETILFVFYHLAGQGIFDFATLHGVKLMLEDLKLLLYSQELCVCCLVGFLVLLNLVLDQIMRVPRSS
jgi:hypothetical protein